MKSKVTDIKARTLINIENNIKDQCSEDTHYLSWSGLDLGDKSMSLEQHLERLASIIELYCVGTTRTVCKYTNKTEKNMEPDTWVGYIIKLIHHGKIKCSAHLHKY